MEKYPTRLEGSHVCRLGYPCFPGGRRIGTLVSGQVDKEPDGWRVQEQGFVYPQGEKVVGVASCDEVTNR